MTAYLEIAASNAVVATILAVVVAGLARVWHRPALLHLLWMIVLLKLLTPPAVRVPVSWPQERIDSWTQSLPKAFVVNAPPLDDGEEDDDAAMDAGGGGGELQPPAGTPAPASPAPAERPTVTALANDGEPAWVVSWPAAIVAVWVLGSVGLLCLTAYRIGSFQRLLRSARPASDELQAEVQRLAATMGLARCPEVCTIPGSVSPLVWAWVGRPRLVLPAALLRRLPAEQRATLIAHELAHLRRHDHWVRWLEVAAVVTYWWHPVAWWARRQLQALEEQCCDAWVVSSLPNASRAYARALLETVNFLGDTRPVMPPVASGVGYVRFLKRRLTMILQQPVHHRLSWSGWLAALLLGLLVLPIVPQRLVAQGKDDDDDDRAPAAMAKQNDDEEEGQPAADSRTQDLERRMRKLESKMDRVLRALERGSRSSSAKPSADDEEGKSKAREAQERMANEAKERAAEMKQRAQEMKERMATEAKQRAQEARARAEELKARLREAREARERAGKDKAASGDRDMDELGRQIQQAVNKAINPERMKEMEQHIQEIINKNLSPERMEAMSRQIEQAVNRAINPQKMEAMARQIEESVNRALRAQQHITARATERAARERSHTDATKPATDGKHGGSSENRDLEQRIRRLEERMDRVLSALEKSRESGK